MLKHLYKTAVLSLVFLILESVQLLHAETYVAFVKRMSMAGQNQGLVQPSLEQELLGLVNGFRRSKGLNSLGFDPGLRAAARAHALDMAQHNFMGHQASTGQDFDSRMHALRDGAMVLPALGENAAMVPGAAFGTVDVAQRLFQAWLKSPPHYHTLVSRDYLTLATGVVLWNGRAYADQIFVGPEVTTNFNRAPQ